jgi:hypothetical protein
MQEWTYENVKNVVVCFCEKMVLYTMYTLNKKYVEIY